MSRSVIQTSVPSTEIVTSADMSPMLHGYPDTEESFLDMTIVSARDYVEGMTGYCLAPRSFIQYLDRWPGQSVFAPLFPIPFPLFGFLPGRGYAARRSPYEIELLRNPAQSLTQIVYNDITGTPQTLTPGVDFAVDLTSVPARVAPMPTPSGQPLKSYWPPCLPGPQAIAIFYSAGYYTTQDEMTTETQPRDMGFPPILKNIVMALTRKWFIDRDSYGEVPPGVMQQLIQNRIVDYVPSIE